LAGLGRGRQILGRPARDTVGRLKTSQVSEGRYSHAVAAAAHAEPREFAARIERTGRGSGLRPGGPDVRT
jgi:hypothetical protein